MVRGLILTALALTVVTTSVLMYQPGEIVKAEVQPQPVNVPYLNMDVKQFETCRQTNEKAAVLRCVGELEEVPVETEEAVTEEINASELTYLGEWTTTAYCACEICCGEWATGCTASGVLATSNHTVACGILPFGTQVLIDGTIYTVEDTGVEGEWIDIFFDSHEEALNYGMQTKAVYLVN